MPTTSMKFSELTTASILSEGDILALSKVDGTSASGYMSYKATMIAIGLYITKLANYTSDLQTTDKTIIGAINELKQLIALIPQFDIEVVEELPTEDISETTIYMVPSENPETENAYDEFIYVDDEWEQVGSTAVDLSAYYTKLEVDGLLDLKENKADMGDDVMEILEDLSDDFTVTGNPVTFETINGGMAKSCEATMLPIQDLHGYEYPWAGGNGKNLLNPNLATTTVNGVTCTNNGDGTYTIDGTATDDTDFTIESFVFPSEGTYRLVGCPRGGSTTTYWLQIRNANFTDIGNGSTAQFTSTGSRNAQIRVKSGYTCSNLLFKPMLSKDTTVTYSDFAPYENICPISGWDGLNLMRNGVNQWDEDWELGLYNTTTGEKSSSASNIRCKNKIPVVPGENLYFVIPTGITMRYLLYYKDQSYSGLTGTKTNGGTLEIPSGIGFMTFHLSSGTTYNNDISINYPSTVTTYEQYKGKSVTIQLGQTVYYGILDVVNGVLKILFAIVDLGSLTWSMTSTSGCFRTHGLDSLAELGTTGQADAISTIYKNNPTARDVESLADSSFCVGGSQSSYKLFLKDTRYTSASDFGSAISGQKICYKLATPIEITLTAEQIELLKGINVLSTDADELKLVASKLANVPDLLTYIKSLEARIKALEEA